MTPVWQPHCESASPGTWTESGQTPILGPAALRVLVPTGSGFQTLSWMGAFRWLRSLVLPEPEIERPKHQDDPDIDHQPLP